MLLSSKFEEPLFVSISFKNRVSFLVTQNP
jgi:hypothetical protein